MQISMANISYKWAINEMILYFCFCLRTIIFNDASYPETKETSGFY